METIYQNPTFIIYKNPTSGEDNMLSVKCLIEHIKGMTLLFCRHSSKLLVRLQRPSAGPRSLCKNGAMDINKILSGLMAEKEQIERSEEHTSELQSPDHL